MDWDRPSRIDSILYRPPFATVWIVSSSSWHTTSVLDLSSPNCTGHLFLLFFFRFSFFLWIKLGLFLLFPFAFVFFPLITHSVSPCLKMNCAGLWRRNPVPSFYDGNESTSRRQAPSPSYGVSRGRNREASSFYPQIAHILTDWTWVLSNKFPHLFFICAYLCLPRLPRSSVRWYRGSSGRWYWGHLRILLMHFPRSIIWRC